MIEQNKTTHRAFKFDKLVRDNIERILLDKNIIVYGHRMHDDEYLTKLRAKLLEETEEVLEAKLDVEIIEEVADVLEVLYSIAEVF